ncbi:hypothetical protein OAT96_01550 [Chitinophagales bacterium]|nr:hypothetical protein [Chitinophagales bacterium]
MNLYLRKASLALLAVLFLFKLNAQDWQVKVFDQDSSRFLIEVYPDFTSNKNYLISFPPSLINQNRVDSIFLGKSKISPLTESSFMLNAEQAMFSYQLRINMNKYTANNACLDYEELFLVNWQEILFHTDTDAPIALEWIEGEVKLALGTKYLSEWRAQPTNLVSTKIFLEINNIKVFTNTPSENLSKLLTETLEEFQFLNKPINLYLIFADDSIASSGVSFKDISIVYIDSKMRSLNAQLQIQQLMLRELFHAYSPYHISPELEVRNIDKNWLSEALPEYLSLIYLLQNDHIDDDTFLAIMEEKMRMTEQFNGLSLDYMSQEIYRNDSYWNAFRSKGCIAVWFLDLKLIEITSGELTAIDLIKGQFSNLDETAQLEIQNIMHVMEEALVFNSSPFMMNKYLIPSGIIYERKGPLPDKRKGSSAAAEESKLIKNEEASDEQKSLWKRFTSDKI